jgi:hypothetical protein
MSRLWPRAAVVSVFDARTAGGPQAAAEAGDVGYRRCGPLISMAELLWRGPQQLRGLPW